MADSSNRRDFLAGAAAGLGWALARPARAHETHPREYDLSDAYRNLQGFAAPPLEVVRIAFVGVGLQGGSHVENFLRLEGVEIKAICDIDEPRANEVAQWVADAGHKTPDLYTRGDLDYRRVLDRDDVDLVFNSTPWRWHVPVCVEAMESGKHTAVEVPAAIDLDGCWQLVETAERTDRHCVMMENCCYGRRELMILQMAREGVLGELLHAECAYIHDLRGIKFSDANEGLWRLAYSVSRNANLYPTHGLGPVAQCLDINRGDQFDYLVSMSSPSRGLALYAEEHLSEDDPRRHQSYALGDMNTSLIRTKLGRTIVLQHDTTSPRPYSRINLVQGTAGTVTGYPDRVFFDGESEDHEWRQLEELKERFDHPLWRALEKQAEGAGHGGMDYLEDYRLVECLRRGEPTDMDVYDAAAWSAPIELSERSVAERSRAIDFPDFTRQRWRGRKPITIPGPTPPSPAAIGP